MKNTRVAKAKKVKNETNYKKNAIAGISFVVMMLMVVLFVQRRSLENKISVYTATEQQLEEQLLQEHQRTEDIEATREYMKTPEYIEKAARDNGLIKDNEIIFKEVK